MNKRPSSSKMKNCKNANNSSNTYGYAIIGDTSSAVLYAQRLIKNGVTTPIHVIIEGVDRSNEENIHNVSFPVEKTKKILHYLRSEQVHLVERGDNQCSDDDDTSEVNQVYHYRVGSGVNGDMIQSYYSPYVGPWYSHSTASRLEKMVSNHTEKSDLNDVEKIVADRIKDELNLSATNNIIAKEPSMLYKHYKFVNEHHSCVKRELFLHEYDYVNNKDNVKVHLQVKGIKFEESATPGLHNITASSGLEEEIENVKVIFKTNAYSYLRIASEGGLDASCAQIPTLYRSVLSIPLNNEPAGVNMTGLSVSEDMLTTHLTFSSHDTKNNKNCAMNWFCTAYTTPEDLSTVTCNGVYADTEKTLLIVEGLSLKNKRKAKYNKCEKEVEVHYNDRNSESAYRRKFAELVAATYKSYTGQVISIETLLGESSICTENVCTDKVLVTDVIHRESPMITVLELTSHMYNSELYGVFPNKC
jgi:hypothetical protein